MVSRASTRPNDFCLPDLGEGLEEAELIEWCVHVGQRVEENETLAKMETAKALKPQNENRKTGQVQYFTGS